MKMLLLYSLELTPFWLTFKFCLTFYDVPMFHLIPFHLKYIKSWDRNSARLQPNVRAHDSSEYLLYNPTTLEHTTGKIRARWALLGANQDQPSCVFQCPLKSSGGADSHGQNFVKLASKGRIIGFFKSSSSYSQYLLP